MKPLSLARTLVAPLFVAAAAWAMPTDDPAGRAPAPEPTAETLALAPGKNCTYYSSPSFTTVVGQYGYDCCNNRIAWGMKTPFYQCGGCFPCFPPPR